jgi:hypothetical protein
MKILNNIEGNLNLILIQLNTIGFIFNWIKFKFQKKERCKLMQKVLKFLLITFIICNYGVKRKNKTNSEKTQIQRKETPLHNPSYGSLTFHLELWKQRSTQILEIHTTLAVWPWGFFKVFWSMLGVWRGVRAVVLNKSRLVPTSNEAWQYVVCLFAHYSNIRTESPYQGVHKDAKTIKFHASTEAKNPKNLKNPWNLCRGLWIWLNTYHRKVTYWHVLQENALLQIQYLMLLASATEQ